MSSAVYGNPQRSATGFDLRRMNIAGCAGETGRFQVGYRRMYSLILPED